MMTVKSHWRTYKPPHYGIAGLKVSRVWTRGLSHFFALMFVWMCRARSSPEHVNRIVPQVEPPKTVLEFSANPTPEEFFRGHFFAEPLVPVGGDPGPAENQALAAALLGYSGRTSPDEFSSLTDFLKQFPQSPWSAALLTDLGLEYYNTAHYSLALDTWRQAWMLAKDAKDLKARALADRAFAELIRMNARLGRMEDIATLLKSVENRPLLGSAAECVAGARAALWSMQNEPQISFRCGPLALRSIRLDLKLPGTSDTEILKAASTQKGCSLPQVAELSRKIGLNYQMALRDKGGEFVVPSVVHWKVGHYAALLRKVGELYELEDPTFGNRTWATRQALEAETTGYFLVASGSLPPGWRAVNQSEGAGVWGKGVTMFNNPQNFGTNDIATGGTCQAQGPGAGIGMAVAKIHLMDVNLNLTDNPVGYTPPVGPAIRFIIRNNQRDSFQPANFNYSNFGALWTSDCISYITDNPTNLLADVNLYLAGGGQRTYTSFDTNSQSFAYQLYDHNLLTRTGPSSYELRPGDGSKLVFSQSDGSISSARNIFVTRMIDPQGNAVSLTYDSNLRIAALTDAIGQVTTLSYELPGDIYKITKVTDPFGRFATFGYDQYNRLTNITDVIGLNSQFTYFNQEILNSQGVVIEVIPTDTILALVTPYGTTSFAASVPGNVRSMEITYPDGSRERVEYNQSVASQPNIDPITSVPTGMSTTDNYLREHTTYYWDRTACGLGYGDYSKARSYHFMKTADLASTAGVLESVKPPLEARVWFDYAGQGSSDVIGSSTQPAHIGRVLDDGSTQLYTYFYNELGHVIESIDPVGRTFRFIYDTNGVDLLEIRQVRAGNNELLFKATYNAQHLPLTRTDAAGQTTTYSYNNRGQKLSETNPQNQTTSYTYDTNGYQVQVHGPLPGTNDTVTATYDAYGRIQTKTDESGYTITLDYDALDRLTTVTYPDGTSTQETYDRLDPVSLTDRAGRKTLLEYDSLRQLRQRTDPLGRITRFEWCSCGDLKRLTDPLGRSTTWNKDVEGRLTSKQFGDGSQITFLYENTTSRVRQLIDERQQITAFDYNPDNTTRLITYPNAAVPTPAVVYTYDPDYVRPASMTDGIGTTAYTYIPIASPPALGAGRLATIDGPLTNDTITFVYDELGRRVQASIDSAVSTTAFDAASRIVAVSNILGNFTLAYDGGTPRLLSQSFPNGMAETRAYRDNVHDDALQEIGYSVGSVAVSEFNYGFDIPKARITVWSQQPGTQPPATYTFAYDDADQLVSGSVTNSGALVGSFAYGYDPVGNRVYELAEGTTNAATYNALNQISSNGDPTGTSRTNEWDAANRLTAVTMGNTRTELAYDGLGRLASIRQLQAGSEISLRRFVWCENELWEERDASGANVTKRFFQQGVSIEAGATAGKYCYTRDHLGSIRELTDGAGNVRARYTYDPFGRQTRVTGDVAADFGFAGMFWSTEVNLNLARFRAYDPEVGRWLSRDPLQNAEANEGPNLYVYVGDNPINDRDPLGLCCEKEAKALLNQIDLVLNICRQLYSAAQSACNRAYKTLPRPDADKACIQAEQTANSACDLLYAQKVPAAAAPYHECRSRPCKQGSYCIPEEPLVPTFWSFPGNPKGEWLDLPYQGPNPFGE